MSRKNTPTDIHAAMAAWGSKGGRARAKKLTPADRKALGKRLAEARKQIPSEERQRIAKNAVAAREEKRRNEKQLAQ